MSVLSLLDHRKTTSDNRSAAAVAVDCRKLKFSYGDLGVSNTIIEDLNLTVRTGEFVCILGRSGCGKTTLLNLVAGFLRPSSGDLIVEGHHVLGPDPQRSMVFQEYSLFPWLTTRGNVEFGLRMKGIGRRERKATAMEYLELVGLSHVAQRYPYQLSGGMKQRAAIARALAPNPRALLMDEPFAALDAMTRTHLQEQLVDIYQQSKMTVMFVTHNLAEAIALGTRIVVLGERGKIIEDIEVAGNYPRTRTGAEFTSIYDRLARALQVRQFE